MSMEIAEKSSPDFIEVRMDYLRDNQKLDDIVGCVNIPLIATIRPKDCRGAFSGSETQRRILLLNAAKKGFDYVDVELSTEGLNEIVKDLRQAGAKPIISYHDFEKTPSIHEMEGILEDQKKSGAEVCKIVTTATAYEDNLTLLTFLRKVSKNFRVVSFAMGSLGKISRMLSPFFGGYFTIASLKRGRETAPGQMTIRELRAVYKALGVS
jgi:3-dehydroquinate dehydratase type I